MMFLCKNYIRHFTINSLSFFLVFFFFSSVEKTGSDEPAFVYYMNDGVYGSFASKLSEDLNTIPEVHKASFIINNTKTALGSLQTELLFLRCIPIFGEML